MTRKPRIIASSVIRSTVRGDSHGGLYVVDFETGEGKQVLDWDFPDIRWDSGGGDRGLRGMAFYDDHLYAAGATYLYKFNKKFELVDKFNNPNFDGTHELCLYEDDIYCVSNSFDAILKFNLKEQEFDWGMQHGYDDSVKEFDPRTENVERKDKLHLDSVGVFAPRMYQQEVWLEGDPRFASKHWNKTPKTIYYAGSTTKYIYQYAPGKDRKNDVIPLFYRNTHNAQRVEDGVFAFNRSLESQTCVQKQGMLLKQWNTPLPQIPGIPGDHARVGYTRGMVIKRQHTPQCKTWIAVGTSPAAIHLYDMDQESHTNPIQSAILTNDIRNSICGMAEYPWEL